MIRICAVAAALALLAACQATGVVNGTTVEPKAVALAPAPGPYNFDCEAPGQQYVQFLARAPSGRVTVKGYLHFERTHWNSEWDPFASIALRDANSTPVVTLQAQVQAQVTGDFKKIGIYTHVPASGQPKQLVAWTPLTYRDIPFSITMNADGTILTAAGASGITVSPAAFSATSIQLACLTAHVTFRDVTVTAAQ